MGAVRARDGSACQAIAGRTDPAHRWTDRRGFVIKRDAGLRYVDVWETKEAWERFQAERVAPAIAALGGPARPEPTFRDLHAVHVVAGAGGAVPTDPRKGEQ